MDLHQSIGDRLTQRIASDTNLLFATVPGCSRQFKSLLRDDHLGRLDCPEPEITAIVDLDCIFHRFVRCSDIDIVSTSHRWKEPQSISIVNRRSAIDSKLLLDGAMRCGDRCDMAHSTFQIYCQRVDDTKNMARYYMISIQPTLFGEIAVVRHWGRIGRAGGEKIEVFETEQEATAHFLDIARRKRARGYKPVSSCGNPRDSAAFAAARR